MAGPGGSAERWAGGRCRHRASTFIFKLTHYRGESARERRPNANTPLGGTHCDRIEFGAGFIVDGNRIASDRFAFDSNKENAVLRFGKIVEEPAALPGVAPE
jgi:hypothetical protein